MTIDIYYPEVQTLSAAQAYRKALLARVAEKHEQAGIIADALFAIAPGSPVEFATDPAAVERLTSVAYLLLHGTITSAMWQSSAGDWYELKRPSVDTFGVNLAAAVADYVQDCRNQAKALSDLIDAAADVAAALAVDLDSGWPSRSVSAVTPLPELVYDVGCWIAGVTTASEIVMGHVAAHAWTLPASFTGSQWEATTAATAQTDLDVLKNGSSIGTVRFAAAGTTATFIAASATSFAAGDVLTVVGPASPDATLANISGTFKGQRAP